MDIGVDLNAKYTIMCRKIVVILIRENDEASTLSSLRQTFTYNSDIFSGTSELMMHSPFNICNRSSFFKFLHNFAISYIAEGLYKP